LKLRHARSGAHQQVARLIELQIDHSALAMMHGSRNFICVVRCGPDLIIPARDEQHRPAYGLGADAGRRRRRGTREQFEWR
jgi:hypothetical protein